MLHEACYLFNVPSLRCVVGTEVYCREIHIFTDIIIIYGVQLVLTYIQLHYICWIDSSNLHNKYSRWGNKNSDISLLDIISSYYYGTYWCILQLVPYIHISEVNNLWGTGYVYCSKLPKGNNIFGKLLVLFDIQNDAFHLNRACENCLVCFIPIINFSNKYARNTPSITFFIIQWFNGLSDVNIYY